MVVEYSTRRHVTASDCGGYDGARHLRALYLEGDWTLVPIGTLVKTPTDRLASASQHGSIDRRPVTGVRCRRVLGIIARGVGGPTPRVRALMSFAGLIIGLAWIVFGGVIAYHR